MEREEILRLIKKCDGDLEAFANAIAAHERELCAKEIPDTWLDPLLTGKQAVIEPPYDERDVEILLNGIRQRIRSRGNKQD